MPQSPRHLALSLLANWTLVHEPPHIPERSDPHWTKLEPRDRNFAFDLLAGIIRRRGTLDAILASQLKMPLDQLEPKVRAALWLGAYELLYRQTPRPHAAVHETVELAKTSGIARSAGLVNAVLRAITRLKPTVQPRAGLTRHSFPRDFAHQLTFAQPLFPNPATDLPAHLAVVTSHPVALVRMLIAAFDEPAATSILLHNNLRPPVIARADHPAFTPPPDPGLVPHETPGFFLADTGFTPALETLIAAGTLSPQDPTSAKVVQRLAQQIENQKSKLENILDLCAGLGTKTIQLARTFPGAKTTATDLDDLKLAALHRRATKLKLPNITTVPLASLPIETGKSKIENLFSAILIDAPCSNTGVMARRVQSRWRWPTLNLEALAQTQLALLHQAAALLAPRGLVAYATCSLDPAENASLIQTFLGHPPRPFALLHQELTLPSSTDAPTQYHDGGYLAILQAQ